MKKKNKFPLDPDDQEMLERTSDVCNEILELLQHRTKSPFEGFIVLGVCQINILRHFNIRVDQTLMQRLRERMDAHLLKEAKPHTEKIQ